eukprot:361788-Chlamydomonas_euryale.AAC.2
MPAGRLPREHACRLQAEGCWEGRANANSLPAARLWGAWAEYPRSAAGSSTTASELHAGRQDQLNCGCMSRMP